VSGLRARGGFEVAMTWDEGQLTEAVLLSLAGEPCTVRYGQATTTFKTTKGKTYRLRIEKGKISVK
jgi:alpha-L-fucosidase 2